MQCTDRSFNLYPSLLKIVINENHIKDFKIPKRRTRQKYRLNLLSSLILLFRRTLKSPQKITLSFDGTTMGGSKFMTLGACYSKSLSLEEIREKRIKKIY